jgi:Putative Flp pilus-assembly TadE/G-like
VGGRLRLDGVGRYRSGGLGRERGQAALLVLGVLAAALAGTLVLFGFGQALGARGKHQRAADLAAVSAAQVLRRRYSRLFEPPSSQAGCPTRAISPTRPTWRSLARQPAAARAATVVRRGGSRSRFRGRGSRPRESGSR